MILGSFVISSASAVACDAGARNADRPAATAKATDRCQPDDDDPRRHPSIERAVTLVAGCAREEGTVSP